MSEAIRLSLDMPITTDSTVKTAVAPSMTKKNSGFI
jgi:hypothetical protein